MMLDGEEYSALARRFQEWARTASEQDKELYYDYILEYEEEYFTDMTFKENSIVDEFLRCEAKEATGEWLKIYYEMPEEMCGIETAWCRYFVGSPPSGGKALACVNLKD